MLFLKHVVKMTTCANFLHIKVKSYVKFYKALYYYFEVHYYARFFYPKLLLQ